MGNLTRNFSRREFSCNCGCGLDDVNPTLAENLQALRDVLRDAWEEEVTIHINSGLRCEAQNRKVGGVRRSQHCLGNAADIVARLKSTGKAIHPTRLAPMASQIDAFRQGGIGVYDTFLHLDVRGKTARWGLAWKRQRLKTV